MNLTLKTKSSIIHAIALSTGALIIGGCLVTFLLGVYYSAMISPPIRKQAVQTSPVVQPKPVVQAPTPTKQQEQPPQVTPAVRYASVEAYFKDAYPNPLTHRFNKPRFARDVSSSQRRRIIERDGGCCLVCGSTICLECDHKRALMNNGGNEDSNLAILCDSCHKLKTRLDWRVKKQRRKLGEHH